LHKSPAKDLRKLTPFLLFSWKATKLAQVSLPAMLASALAHQQALYHPLGRERYNPSN